MENNTNEYSQYNEQQTFSKPLSITEQEASDMLLKGILAAVFAVVFPPVGIGFSVSTRKMRNRLIKRAGGIYGKAKVGGIIGTASIFLAIGMMIFYLGLFVYLLGFGVMTVGFMSELATLIKYYN